MIKRKVTFKQLLAIVAIWMLVLLVIMWALKPNGTSNRSREARQLKQIYVAAMLYKGDNDGQLPDSLVTLRTTNYLPSQALTNPSDHRLGLKLADWPANPWIRTPIFGDPPHLIRQRFSELNSYAFLPSWKTRYNYKMPFEEFIQQPSSGLITGLGLMNCKTILGFPVCNYYIKDVAIDSGHPSMNLNGTVMSITVDGSITTRFRATPVGTADMSMEQLFMNRDLQGGQTGAKPIRANAGTSPGNP